MTSLSPLSSCTQSPLMHINRKKTGILPLAGLLLGAVLANGVLSAPLHAEETMPPPHHHGHHGTILSFSSEGKARSVPTLLTLHLSARSDSLSPADAQQKLNQMMDRAMKLASGHDGITARAEDYNVSEDYSQHGPKRWSATQELSLSGKDTTQIFALTEQLQHQGLTMDSITWSLEPSVRDRLEAKAREEALKKIRSQAESDAALLGLRVAHIDRIVIGDMMPSDGPRPFMMMTAARMNDSTPPQGTAKEQVVRVHVSAQFRLVPASQQKADEE